MGKNILLVAATAKEIVPFIELIKKESNPFGRKNIDILISGIGLTACTYSLSRQLLLKKYSLVIQAGVAGCFDQKMALGSVVVVGRDTIADQSVIELKKLKTMFDLRLIPADQYPFMNGWLKNPDTLLLKSTRFKIVNGISVNQISTSKKTIDFYRNTFMPVSESMEGAALHYVCLMEKVSFLQLRSFSNYIGERNKKKWDLEESVKNLTNALISIIKNY